MDAWLPVCEAVAAVVFDSLEELPNIVKATLRSSDEFSGHSLVDGNYCYIFLIFSSPEIDTDPLPLPLEMLIFGKSISTRKLTKLPAACNVPAKHSLVFHCQTASVSPELKLTSAAETKARTHVALSDQTTRQDKLGIKIKIGSFSRWRWDINVYATLLLILF